MAQIRNRFDIQEAVNDDMTSIKTLPNFFIDDDDIHPFLGMVYSVLTHVLFAIVLVCILFLQELIFPRLPKPELPDRDIEFKFVQNQSKPPINKNTKIRSDRDSQAGGVHDPKRMISEPSKKVESAQKNPAPKQQPAQKRVVKSQPKPTIKPQVKSEAKPQAKPQPKPQPVVPAVKKPTAIKAPSVAKPTVKPVAKPSGVSAPVAPKITQAPKSPFQVAAPEVKGPVGSTYKPSSGSASSGSSGSSAAPAPKFSSSGGSSGSSSSGSQGAKYASRGSSGGYSAGGNPSPGNPNGAPGIDAIRQPNWGPYMRDLEQRIKRNWSPPKGDSSKRVIITFTIGRDGRLLSHKVTKSSGSPLADRAALSAIELTAPFRPLPPEFKGQSIPIEFTFDYNVLNSVIR